jgi:two-component sensor histidine kinase
VIKSLVGQPIISGRSIEDYVASLRGRVQALSFAHDQIVRGEGGGSLVDLLNAELSPYRSATNAISLPDDGTWLDSRAYSVMALVLHELATNAAKYGALSVSGGHLAVTSRIASNGDALIDWVERNGPPVSPPSREGFGTALLDRSVPFDLGGESAVNYLPEGLTATFRLPARHVRRKPSAGGKGTSRIEPAAANTDDLPRDLRIMLLEDQMLIAMDVEGMLADRGFTAVSTVNSVSEANKLIGRAPPALAVLDVNLGDETSINVALRLRDMNVPFVFATGYGESRVIPAELADVPVVRKPYDAESLIRALHRSFAA